MNFMKVALQIIFETESLFAKSADLKSNSSLTPRIGAKVRLKQVDVPSFAWKGKPDRSAFGFLYAMAPEARSLLGGNRRSGFPFLPGFTSSALSPLLMVLTLIQVIWLLVFKVKLKAKPILT